MSSLSELAVSRIAIDPNRFVETISLNAEMVNPVSFARPVCSDPDDDKFLEAALAGSADFVVSGDKALLAVKSFRGTDIITPAQFLIELKNWNQDG